MMSTQSVDWRLTALDLEARVARLEAELRAAQQKIVLLKCERDEYVLTAEWLLAEGGWRITHYQRTGPRPPLIDVRDPWNPRLILPAEWPPPGKP